jgi:hypothetical protein
MCGFYLHGRRSIIIFRSVELKLKKTESVSAGYIYQELLDSIIFCSIVIKSTYSKKRTEKKKKREREREKEGETCNEVSNATARNINSPLFLRDRRCFKQLLPPACQGLQLGPYRSVAES